MMSPTPTVTNTTTPSSRMGIDVSRFLGQWMPVRAMSCRWQDDSVSLAQAFFVFLILKSPTNPTPPSAATGDCRVLGREWMSTDTVRLQWSARNSTAISFPLIIGNGSRNKMIDLVTRPMDTRATEAPSFHQGQVVARMVNGHAIRDWSVMEKPDITMKSPCLPCSNPDVDVTRRLRFMRPDQTSVNPDSDFKQLSRVSRGSSSSRHSRIIRTRDGRMLEYV